MRNKILIYKDYGTNSIENLKKELIQYYTPLGVSIEETNANAIIKENSLNDKVLALFMPGGRATPYYEKLKVQGNQKISEYIKNGGVYFGICAGAYYASKEVFFEMDVKELAIQQKCDLNILSAETIGTLYKELNISPYSKDFNSITVAKVKWQKDNETHFSCYHGGPYFKLDENRDVSVLAYYDINGNLLPAAVSENYGLGKVIATGLHFEDRGQELRKILDSVCSDKKHALDVVENLEKNEPSRNALFNKFMQEIISR